MPKHINIHSVTTAFYSSDPVSQCSKCPTNVPKKINILCKILSAGISMLGIMRWRENYSVLPASVKTKINEAAVVATAMLRDTHQRGLFVAIN